MEQIKGLSIGEAIQALTNHANKYNNFLCEVVAQQKDMVKGYEAEKSSKESSGGPGNGSAGSRPVDDLLAKSSADQNEAAGNDASHNTPQPQEDQIYNFDLLHKTGGHQLDASDQSLRRHFVSDSTEADSYTEPELYAKQSTKLISPTPERELSLKSTSPIEATTLKPLLSLKSTLLKEATTLKPVDMRLRDGRCTCSLVSCLILLIYSTVCHTIICRYFKQGYCAAGDTCKYWHNDTPKESRPVCRYFAAVSFEMLSWIETC